MKNLLLLIPFLWMSLNAFSQTILQSDTGDTLFCFSVEETRRLVKSIEQGRFCDSTVLLLERENRQLQAVNENQKEIIQTKDAKLLNLEAVIVNEQHSKALLKDAMLEEKRRVKRQRNQKLIVTGAGILFGVLALF